MMIFVGESSQIGASSGRFFKISFRFVLLFFELLRLKRIVVHCRLIEHGPFLVTLTNHMTANMELSHVTGNVLMMRGCPYPIYHFLYLTIIHSSIPMFLCLEGLILRLAFFNGTSLGSLFMMKLSLTSRLENIFLCRSSQLYLPSGNFR